MNNDLAALFGGVAFDPSSVEPAEDFVVLPPGEYPCLIESAEVKQTKAGTGYGLQLTLLVLDGPNKNRKLFPWINLQNPNQTCEEIGRREFAALCEAVGFSAVDTTQLINRVIVAHVKVKDDRNNVRTYSSPTEAQPQAGDAVTPTRPRNPEPAPIVATPTPAPINPGIGTATAPLQRPWER